MLDESLLDDPAALERADDRGLLRSTAEAGARLRAAARQAEEAGVGALRPDGKPRGVLIAGSGAATAGTADLLAAFVGGGCPVHRVAPTGAAPAPGTLHWTLPGWAGPLDLLLVITADGYEPGLSLLVEQAYRRGCNTVALAPAGSPLSDAVLQARGFAVGLAAEPHGTVSDARHTLGGQPDSAPPEPPSGVLPDPPGTLWAFLTPLLALLDQIGLCAAPADTLRRTADRLDRVAELCGPRAGSYGNPAKTLATELDGTLPLLWTEGAAARAVARRFAASLAGLAGRPALTAALPEALSAHEALLTGAFTDPDGPDDFFRDRVEDPDTSLRPRVVLSRDRESPGAAREADGAGPVVPPRLSAAPAARELARACGVPVSELEPAEGGPLESVAELLAVTDFAAVYLALGTPRRS